MAKPGKKAHRLGLMSSNLFDEPHRATRTQEAILPEEFDGSAPESSYVELVPLEHRKRFAQFFTPEPLAQLMVDWVMAVEPKAILDPAVGPGIFLRLAASEPTAPELLGIELDPVAFSAARIALASSKSELLLQDFLTWKSNRKFDGIVANPPYLRHHDMPYVEDMHAEIAARNGVLLSKLANIYVLFILEICRRLKVGGRAAIIVPGEWSNSNFGMPLKNYLLKGGLLKKLIYFSNLADQFPDATTTAAILLVERDSDKERVDQEALQVESFFVEKGAHVGQLRRAIFNNEVDCNTIVHRKFANNTLAKLEKWDKVLRHGVAEQVPGFAPLGEIARSRRGIATGANGFFHLTDQTAAKLKIQPSNLKSCIGRSEDVRGLKFTPEDFERNRAENSKVWLLSFESVPDANEEKYLQQGEADGLGKRYLLAGRKPWYSMEKRPPSQIWAAVFGRASLRFVYNEAGVSNLTTFHCLYLEDAAPKFCKALVACLNSRRVQSLAEHQRRVYGGGLMKFEPKDLLSIQIPLLTAASEKTVDALAAVLDKMDCQLRDFGEITDELSEELDRLVLRAASTTK